jgi:neutral ceramidase
VIGLANGFLQYVTTRAEYGWQAYEGGSNLYGPGMAAFLEKRIGELAVTLPAGRDAPSPPATIEPITAYPGAPSRIMSLPGSTGSTVGPIGLTCDGGRLVGKWNDMGPGAIFPRDSVWVRLSVRSDDGSWVPVAHDGDGDLEIHLDGTAKKANEFHWRAVWLKVSQSGRQYLLERLDSLGASVTTSGRTLCP